MLVLIWLTLLISVRGNNADTGASEKTETFCRGDFCITLQGGEITAEAGLCVVIPCSFTTSPVLINQNIDWFKCEPSKRSCGETGVIFSVNRTNVQSEFKGRVSLLEPDMSQRNCSIIVNNLTASDSGSYQLRVNGISRLRMNQIYYTYTLKANVSIKALTQKPTVMVPPLTEGHHTTLSCTAPGLCSGSAPEITWMWRGGGENDSHITGNITASNTKHLNAVSQRHTSFIIFNPSFTQHHNTEVTCKVTFMNNITTEETVTLIMDNQNWTNALLPWAVAAVSLTVNVVLIVSLIFHWNKIKTAKPNQEDRTYMSLQRTSPTSEYDVIV